MKVRDSVINDVTMTYVSTVSATTSIETMKEELM